MLVLSFAHVFGCLWHVVGSGGQAKSWINFMQLQNEEWPVRYCYAIYWSMMTISTVGYGDAGA